MFGVARESDIITYFLPGSPTPLKPLYVSIPPEVCSNSITVGGKKACLTPFSFIDESTGLIFTNDPATLPLVIARQRFFESLNMSLQGDLVLVSDSTGIKGAGAITTGSLKTIY